MRYQLRVLFHARAVRLHGMRMNLTCCTFFYLHTYIPIYPRFTPLPPGIWTWARWHLFTPHLHVWQLSF